LITMANSKSSPLIVVGTADNVAIASRVMGRMVHRASGSFVFLGSAEAEPVMLQTGSESLEFGGGIIFIGLESVFEI